MLAAWGRSTLAAEPGAAPSPKVDFNREVRPVLAKNCFPCHGQDEAKRARGLRLDRRESATKPLKSGETAIVPGDPESSELILRVTEDDETIRMPPKKMGNRLSPAEVEVLRRWIEQGAEYAQHWALIVPEALPLPKVRDTAWPRNGLDYWILARLEKEGIQPSPEADRHSLLRRVSLDLRGLPPTPRELERFIQDPAPDAFERAVDRFLDDPGYGERWARMWLDLARYADSAGLGSDPLRPHMWRYRDWVIDAFNRNIPYDQFTVQQIAGDLLPNPGLAERMATAFHRNTMTNTEGGTDDEEFRVAAIKDRVDTTAQVRPIQFRRQHAGISRQERDGRADLAPRSPPAPTRSHESRVVDPQRVRIDNEPSMSQPSARPWGAAGASATDPTRRDLPQIGHQRSRPGAAASGIGRHRLRVVAGDAKSHNHGREIPRAEARLAVALDVRRARKARHEDEEDRALRDEQTQPITKMMKRTHFWAKWAIYSEYSRMGSRRE